MASIPARSTAFEKGPRVAQLMKCIPSGSEKRDKMLSFNMSFINVIPLNFRAKTLKYHPKSPYFVTILYYFINK
jgi:hypothetical protein